MIIYDQRYEQLLLINSQTKKLQTYMDKNMFFGYKYVIVNTR